MKHIMGNSPKCAECLWYQEPEAGDRCKYDGWCTCKKHLSIGINGRKLLKPPERMPVMWMWECNFWKDAEYPHVNHFEAVTHKPDPNRDGMERIIIAEAIAKAEEEQRRRRND